MKFEIGLLGLACVLAVGCASSDAEGGSSLGDSSAFLGIYQLTAFTENATSCDSPGASTLATKKDQFFVVSNGQVFGQKYSMVTSCASVSDCQSKRAKAAAFEFYAVEFSYTLTSTVNASTLSGFEAGTGTGASDGSATCVRRTYAEHTLTLGSGHALHLESRTKKLADKPKDEDGFCFVDPAQSKQEAAGMPCTSSETLDGTFLQAE